MKRIILFLLLISSVQANQVTDYICYDIAEFNNSPNWHELWDVNTIKQLVSWLKLKNITLSADLKEHIVHIYGIATILGKPFGLGVTFGKSVESSSAEPIDFPH